MKNIPARGLPTRVVVPVLLIIAGFAAIPIVHFLQIGFGTNGSSIGTSSSNAAPPPAVAAELRDLRARIERNPRDTEALTSLAAMYRQIGETAQAEAYEARARATRQGQ